MTKLEGAVVLITGARGGFGAELTKQLLQANSRLILSDLAFSEEFTNSLAEIKKAVTRGEIINCLSADLISL